MIKPQHLWRRPGRWLRRTGWVLSQMRADFGFAPGRTPVWLRDNPFLLKAGRAETRRLGLGLRLATVIVILGGLLVGGLALQAHDPDGAANATGGIFGASFPVALFAAVSFIHVLLIANARASVSVPLADEARRATLPDLLLTPLRRGEMLLAMGVGPARSAFLTALAGLPVYALLGEFGGLTFGEVGCLYVLFALLCYQPPTYAVPALSGLAATPEAQPGQFAALPNRRAARFAGYFGIGFPLVLGYVLIGQALGMLGGGWLAHLFSALHLTLLSGFSFLIFFTWPYYADQLLSDRLPFFDGTLSPLFYVLPLVALYWAGSALTTASALSSGDSMEMRRLPVWTRAQTLGRWTVRAAGFCVLAVLWRAWVESGDTGSLAGEFVSGSDWNAAGLLLLLAVCSMPNVCGRALIADLRPFPVRVLRRGLKHSLRPLWVAAGMYGLACLFGRLSPFAAPVYGAAGKIALTGISTVFWAVGVRRVLPRMGRWVTSLLLYAVPFAALSLPGLTLGAAFSPASAWVSLLAGGPALVSRFPVWHVETLPSFWVCVAGPFGVGLALTLLTSRRPRLEHAVPLPLKSLPIKRVRIRNESRTAALMAWITARTDNPLFTYEMRARTRSGQWFVWAVGLPLGYAVAVLAAIVVPSLIDGFTVSSPFNFFNNGLLGSVETALKELALLLLIGQFYLLGFRGAALGQSLIVRDQQRGTWGFILLTPLSVRQIFWGKVFGQTAAVAVIWAAGALGALALYALPSPSVGFGPALGAWASGELFTAALLALGVSLGTVVAMFPRVQKMFRGLATLLFLLLIGLSVYAETQLFPSDARDDWSTLALRLAFGSVYALLLSAGLFRLALWRLSRLRSRDVVFGDGAG